MLFWILLLYFAFGLALTCYLSARELGVAPLAAVVTILRGGFVAPIEWLWSLWKNRKGAALLLVGLGSLGLFPLPTAHCPLPTASASPCLDNRCPLQEPPRHSQWYRADLWIPRSADAPAKYADPSVPNKTRHERRVDRRQNRR